MLPPPENFNPPPPGSPWDVLTAADVAKWLKCSKEQVRRMADGRADHRLPSFRVGNRWRFLQSDVVEFIQKRKAKAA